MMTIKNYQIKGSRRFSNYWWASIILLGGVGFFLVGITSYENLSSYFSIKIHSINFIPQGAIMTFYGLTAIIISTFLWYTIFFDVGSGYNEFNKSTGIITIFRFGFPGKNRILKLQYRLKDIMSIKISIQEGLSPKREIYLKMKDKRQIPLTKVGEPIPLVEIEKQAKDIAIFLDVNVEGQY